jgi:DNA-binding LacI/PurR family transcriptional regulator
MTPSDLEAALRQRVQQARHGERLPPVRALMREYRVGQAVLQEILARVARQGLLSMRVGRGTFVQKTDDVMAPRSIRGARVLLLSARVQSDRSHLVARLMHEQLSELGATCIQVVYRHIEETLEVLRSNMRVDACVLQSYFYRVPLGLLSYLRERCPVLVVDGGRVDGLDIDAISSDWRSAMDICIERLRGEGHERIGFISWPGEVPPLEGLRHHFVSLRRLLGLSEKQMPLLELARMPSAGESSWELVRQAIDQLWRGAMRPTALLLWGPKSDVHLMLAELRQRGIKVPQNLSIVMIGHVDVPTEHGDVLDIVGSRSSDAVAMLVQQVQSRIENPQRPGARAYLPVQYVQAGSVGPPQQRKSRRTRPVGLLTKL